MDPGGSLRGGEGTVYRVGNGVTAPKPVYTPDPEYSEAARKANFEGSVVLAVVVGLDGRIREAHMVKPAGLGLDKQAIQAVETWQFKPAMRDGVPVPTMVNVEVSFNLYKRH